MKYYFCILLYFFIMASCSINDNGAITDDNCDNKMDGIFRAKVNGFAFENRCSRINILNEPITKGFDIKDDYQDPITLDRIDDVIWLSFAIYNPQFDSINCFTATRGSTFSAENLGGMHILYKPIDKLIDYSTTTDNGTMEICIEEMNLNQGGKIIGTFSGQLSNFKDTTDILTVTEGEFNITL